jgi:hypothetical protein
MTGTSVKVGQNGNVTIRLASNQQQSTNSGVSPRKQKKIDYHNAMTSWVTGKQDKEIKAATDSIKAKYAPRIAYHQDMAKHIAQAPQRPRMA